MKTYIKHLTVPTLLLFIASIFVSCNDNDDPLVITSLSLSEETLNVSADGGTYSIVLNAGQDWVVSSDKEWCMVTPANGYGSTVCEIRIDSSYLYKERTANLTFRGRNSSRNLTINQLGYEKVIKLEKDFIEVKDFNEYDKMFEDLKVTSNIKYDVEIEYEDPNKTDWIKVKQENVKVSSKPMTSTIRISYEMYADSDKDRIATLIFRQKDVESGENPVETRLKFQQKKAQEIIPSREGDSLALLAVARIMKCAVNWDTSLPLIHWNNIETEEIEYINHEGKKVDELRVVGLRLTQFNTNKSIPYQIRKLDQLRTLIFTGNYNAMCRQDIDILKAVALLRAMRDTPAMKAELYPRYLRLLEADRALLAEYTAMLEEFAALRPCLPMTGMCENELYMYIDHAQWRMDRIEEYLKENR